MIILLALILSTLSYGYDSYQFSGEFNDSIIYHYQNMLLIREVDQLQIETQPRIPQTSYISDMSARDCILVLKPKSHFVIKKVNQGIQVKCYDKAESAEQFNILLDAGHGGKDPGAISKEGLKEKDVALGFVVQLNKLLTKRFEGRVHLTRNSDMHLDKYQRLKKVLELKPDLMISIHADAFFTPNAAGFGAIHLNEGQGSKKSQQIMEAFNAQPSESMREQSKSFAQDILNDLNGNYRLHNTRPTSEALVILRSPWSRSILLELGFLSNPDEAKKLADSEYIMKLASDLAQSIERYILKNEGIIKIGYVD